MKIKKNSSTLFILLFLLMSNRFLVSKSFSNGNEGEKQKLKMMGTAIYCKFLTISTTRKAARIVIYLSIYYRLFLSLFPPVSVFGINFNSSFKTFGFTYRNDFRAALWIRSALVPLRCNLTFKLTVASWFCIFIFFFGGMSSKVRRLDGTFVVI